MKGIWARRNFLAQHHYCYYCYFMIVYNKSRMHTYMDTSTTTRSRALSETLVFVRVFRCEWALNHKIVVESNADALTYMLGAYLCVG